MEVLFGRQALLIHGYAREVSDEEDIFIPVDVIRILLQFFNQIFIWKIDDKKWKTLFQTKNGKAYYSNIFDIHNVKFICSICPDGWKRKQKGKVQFYLETATFPDTIKSMTVFYQIFCKQTQTNWKNIRKFTKKKQATGWYSNTLKRSDLYGVKDEKLDFYCYVDVLHIEYVSKKIDYIKLVQMKTACRYKWDFDDGLLRKCKKAMEEQAFCSPSFGGDIDGNFCMSFIPKKERSSWIELKLLRLPTGLKSVEISVVIVCYSNGLDYSVVDSAIYTMDYDKNKIHLMKIFSEVVGYTDKLSFKANILVRGGSTWERKNVTFNRTRDWVVLP